MLKLNLVRFCALIILLLLVVASPIAAQGQSLTLKSLLIELWPEFDRAETLVIYRVELDPTVSLPVQVSFRLPEYLDQIFVVAVEQNGRLVEVPAGQYELTKAGAQQLLTFSTTASRFQFEYYDPQLLTKQGAERQLTFTIPTSYAVAKATLEVQEPVQTEKFSMQPNPTSTFTGNDGLTYHIYEVTDVAAGESLALTASYQRQTDALSAASEHAADLPPPPVSALPPTSPEPDSQNLTIGYGLIGIGVVLLLGVVGWWLWSKRAAAPRSASPKPHPAGAPIPAITTTGSGYCYRCGAALREGASFCHACGAERRKQ